MEKAQTARPMWGEKALKLYVLALDLAAATPGFYDVKGAGHGDKATNHYMAALRQQAKMKFGFDYSEKRACNETKHAFDFYFPEDRTVVEVALSLRNPTSEYERDIFKCLIAREEGIPIDVLLFISKPNAIARHEAPGSKKIEALVKKHFGLTVDILELLPGIGAKELLARVATATP